MPFNPTTGDYQPPTTIFNYVLLVDLTAAINLVNEPLSVVAFGANGDGSTDNVTAFTNAAAPGLMVYVPKPDVGYHFSAPLSGLETAWLPDPGMTWDQLTDGGNFNFWRGRATDLSSGANIWRFSDRVFVAGAAVQYAGNDTDVPDGGNSWLGDDATAPAYLATNAGVLFINGGAPDGTLNLPYGIVSGVQTSVAGQSVIGFGAAIIGDTADSAWGAIYELQREANNQTFAIEVAAKNKSNNQTMTPNAQTTGVFGLWLAGGGDNAFGGSATNPSTAGVVFLKNASTWNTGIVFLKDSLTAGEAMALSSEGTGGAHQLTWYNAAGDQVFHVLASATATDTWLLDRDNSGVTFRRSSNAKLQIDNSSTAGNTALLLYDVDNNTLERVTVGVANSGGAGFKLLRIPN